MVTIKEADVLYLPYFRFRSALPTWCHLCIPDDKVSFSALDHILDSSFANSFLPERNVFRIAYHTNSDMCFQLQKVVHSFYPQVILC